MTDRLLSLNEIAEAVGVTTRTLSNYRREGALPEPVKLAGKSLRWRESEINEWIAAGCPMHKVEA